MAVQGGNVTIRHLQWGPVHIYNTTLGCVAEAGGPPAPTVTLVAETPAQLQWGILLLGLLQPFTVILPRDMTVPVDSWPAGLVLNASMVLRGLPPPNPRTILDLNQVRLCIYILILILIYLSFYYIYKYHCYYCIMLYNVL